MQHIKLVLIGFGNVGRAFAKLVEMKRETLATQFGITTHIVGILTGRHGGVLDPEGIEIESAISLIEKGRSLEELGQMQFTEGAVNLIRASGAHVMLENTPVDYDSGQPAINHIETALESGMHAITANKGPVVHAYRELTKLATSQKRKFFFESTVMDGAPIFSIWRSGLPGAKLRSFRGVLNSTTNLILSLMETGTSFEDAIRKAQSIGIAETDPSGDLEGWDAAVKVAALTTVLMDHPLLPSQVDRQGIEDFNTEIVTSAANENKRWKLVCEAQRSSHGVTARVSPQMLAAEDPLFNVMGTSSAITFHSDVLGALTVLEEDPGPHTTAYGLLADMLNALGHKPAVI